MKKHVIIFMMLFTAIMYSQTKKNGTVYNEHPAITIVEAMQKADIAGDADKVATFLSDDFRSLSGTSTDKDDKGTNKEDYLNWVKNRTKMISYGSIERQSGAYPDAIEYKESGVWVQTWDYIRGIHNETGVKIDMPVHTLYRLNKDNKIVAMINYSANPGDEIRRSFTPRTNGTIYNNHEYINTVRKMMGALEHSDADKGFSYFAEDAKFSNLDMGRDETHTVAEEKDGFKKMLETWTIASIDVNGYPDYFNYELGNGKVVQSWWDVRLTRKSDGKKVIIPMLLVHNFNDDGKIIREMGYYTLHALSAK